MTTQMSSREFNQDTGAAKRAAASGPVYITDRGEPAHVLLTFDAYEQLLGKNRVLDLLAQPEGVEAIDIPISKSSEEARPAAFG